MKIIIYYRKSTDRDDKQANSLEHQLENCLRVAEKYNLDIVKQIGESRSAKTEWTRPWFNELIKLCKTWKVDYIIIDEPKRLSRNNIDTSRIIDLMDKKLIKWVLWTSREYKSDNSRDKFLLQLDLSLSKMDNEDRSKDVKDKMTTCIQNTWRFLFKAPFWYKNITIKKWHKEIIVNEKEAKVVKEIYALRLENKAYSTIWKIIKEKYWNKIDLKLNANSVHKIISRKFYYWVFTWNGKEIKWSHKPIIAKKVYDKANGVVKWIYENKKIALNRESRTYYLKWFVKDNSWIMLCAYTKKWQSYYLNQPRSNLKLNINENIIFERFWEILKQFDTQNEILTEIDKDIILDLLKEKEWEKNNGLLDITKEIQKLKEKQDKLLDMSLEWKINENIYLEKNNQIENQIQDLEEEKKNYKNDDFEAKTKILFELAGSLYTSYYMADKYLKAEIIKKLLFELFITTKKELQIRENPLFESSKMLHFAFGTPTENWTPISALRRPHPNH